MQVQQYNRHFRNLVAVSFPSYDATSSKIAKRRIGLSIYQQVVDQGGRFLDAQGTELDRSKGVLKVMKALKDAKTWTSEAKRQAKERRESRAKDGTAKGDKQAPNTGDKTKATTVKPPATDPTPAVVPDLPSPPPVPVPETSPDEEPEKEAKVVDPKPVDAEKEEEPAKSEDTKSTKKDEKDSKPAKAEKEKKSAKTDKDTKNSEKATKKADKEAKTETADTEKDSVASSRRRRASKRRVQLPLTGSPPAKAAKKGKGGDDGSVDSNDAVRGLQLLSQAVAHGKSEKV
jgi:outer membrane biosynthesis protein TonB